MKIYPNKINLDLVGIGASVLCALHCALLPLIFTALPVLGMDLLGHHELEWCIMGVSFIVGCLSLLKGYFNSHRKLLPLLLFIVGFSLLIIGHYLLHHYTTAVITLGAVLLLVAHLLNWQYCKKHGHC